jgi:hypothetical protein
MAVDILYITQRPINLVELEAILEKDGFQTFLEDENSQLTVYLAKVPDFRNSISDYCRWSLIEEEMDLTEIAVPRLQALGATNLPVLTVFTIFVISAKFASVRGMIAMFKAVLGQYGGWAACSDLRAVYSLTTIDSFTFTDCGYA